MWQLKLKHRHYLFALFFLGLTGNIQSQPIIQKGKALMDSANYHAAHSYFQEKLDSCQNNCPDSLKGYLHVYFGKNLHLLDKYDTALMHYHLGINIFNELSDINGQTFGYTSLAEFYRFITQADRGIPYLEIVDSLIQYKKPSLRNLAYFYNRYAALVNESSTSYDKVLGYSKKVLSLARALDDHDLEASSLNEIAFVYEKTDDELSISYYTQALEIYQALDYPRYVASTLTSLSRAYFRFLRYEESLEFVQQGVDLCAKHGWIRSLHELYWVQYMNYKQLGEIDLALEAMERFHATEVESLRQEWDKAIVEMEAKYNLSEKEKLIAKTKNAETFARLESERKSKQVLILVIIGFSLLSILAVLYWTFVKTKKNNTLLNQMVEEKEILMQEVHHRVKNNLTFLKSLLYLRSKASNDEKVQVILNECQARIHSMAVVHQNLYDVDDATKIDFKKFIKELFKDVASMYAQKSIDLRINCDCILIDMQVSIFMGLILNELLTNSFKYASNVRTIDAFTISLHENKTNFFLEYCDHGKGLPPDFDIFQSNGFGFKLIRILLDQLDAKLILCGEPLNQFTIEIPK